MKRENKLLIGGLLILILVGVGLLGQRPENANASVVDGMAYVSTTTSAGGGFYNNVSRTLTQGQGTFGSVVVASTTVGIFTVYDATTTNALLRGSIATTSLPILAKFGASPANGTYQFDSVFTNGLLIEAAANFQGSYTVTWRK